MTGITGRECGCAEAAAAAGCAKAMGAEPTGTWPGGNARKRCWGPGGGPTATGIMPRTSSGFGSFGYSFFAGSFPVLVGMRICRKVQRFDEGKRTKKGNKRAPQENG